MTAPALAPSNSSPHLSVLMICPQFRPVIGGYERAAERLSAQLAADGHDVSVVTFRLKQEWPRHEKILGFNVIRLWCLPYRGVSSITTVASLLWYLIYHGRKFPVWHAHAVTPAVALAFMVGRVLGKKTVLKLPSSGPGGVQIAARSGMFGRLGITAMGLKLATAVVAPSRRGADEAHEMFNPNTRIECIPNGVDTDAYEPPSPKQKDKARRDLELPHDALICLTVCRLDPAKNLPLMLAAWARIKSKEKGKAILVIVGGGPLEPSLKEMAREMEISETVLFIGASNDVLTWYHAADIYLLSSDREGLSNSLLEAMACGLPVVMTSVGGKEFVVGPPQCGTVVPVGDDVAFARETLRLLESEKLRRARGEAARSVVSKTVSLSSTAKRLQCLYEEISARGSTQ